MEHEITKPTTTALGPFDRLQRSINTPTHPQFAPRVMSFLRQPQRRRSCDSRPLQPERFLAASQTSCACGGLPAAPVAGWKPSGGAACWRCSACLPRWRSTPGQVSLFTLEWKWEAKGFGWVGNLKKVNGSDLSFDVVLQLLHASWLDAETVLFFLSTCTCRLSCYFLYYVAFVHCLGVCCNIWSYLKP